MANTRSRVSNDLATISGLCVPRLGIVLGGRGRSRADTEDCGPLEDLLAQVLVVERGITNSLMSREDERL